MSAFSVSDNHINVLVQFAADRARNGTLYTGRNGHDLESLLGRVELGQILRNANGASIEAKYGAREYDYEYAPVKLGNLTEKDIISAIRCFDYQACEYDGWYDSEARNVLIAIERLAVDALTDGDSDVWAL